MKRVSGVDAAFLYGETSSWHMHVSAVLIADPSTAPAGFSVERLKQRIGERLHLAPQFRWRLVEVPFGVDRPVFVEDPDFDIDLHVRRIGVPPPGGSEQLGNLIGDLVSIKLDRRKPLWEFWVIEGLEGGRVAVLAKVHHSIVDGITGSELASVLFDLVPEGTDIPPEDGPRPLEPIPNPFELFFRGLAASMITPWRVARFVGQTVRQGLSFLGFATGDGGPPPIPFQAPRTSFNTELTPHRRFAYTSVPLDQVKALRRTYDVKLNDVVLALCAGSLRRYLEARGELPHAPLIAQVPVSLRSDDDREVGTKVGAMFASLATDVDDPVLRLLAINESTRSAKEMQRALAADKIMGITETAPPALISLAARMYTLAQLDRVTPPIMNLIISNVPGPPFPLYVAGAEIQSMYPMGPLLYGTGVNVTVFSYRDSIDFGFMVCREVVPDAWSLAEGIDLSLAELVKAAEELDVG